MKRSILHKIYLKTALAVLIVLSVSHSSLSAFCSAVSITDSLSLVKLFQATDGENWENNSGWLDAPITQWHGVSLTEDGCNVQDIELKNNGLNGIIPADLNLLFARSFILSHNNLSGEVPNFSGVPTLIHLDISNNSFSGSLPDFSNIESLQYLNIESNEIDGNIPDFSNLPQLTDLLLCPNLFEGSIPDFQACPDLDWEVSTFQCLTTVKLTGYVFFDTNKNCLQDEGEPALPNTFVTIDDGKTSVLTDEDGFYVAEIGYGTHAIASTPKNEVWRQGCVNGNEIAAPINIQNPGDGFLKGNIAMWDIAECPYMTVSLGTSYLRRCMPNNYAIEYCNEGSEAATEVSVELTFPEEIIPIDSSIPFTQEDDKYLFQIGDVDILECGIFTVTTQVDCEATLGGTSCVQALIFPNTICGAVAADWDGSNIIVEGHCAGETVDFQILNVGQNMDSPSLYRVYEDDILYAVEPFDLGTSESISLSFDSNGSTYRVEADQHPGHPIKSFSQATVELCNYYDSELGYVTTQADGFKNYLAAIDCNEIIGSFDPNDKSVKPKGIGEEHIIDEDDILKYKIRFQNVGNDTAFNVMIHDTLNHDRLQLGSINIGAVSHSYTYDLIDNNVLVFQFDNILLPDSTINEPFSHGFVEFTIKQRNGNPIGTVIENSAAITFDFNEPIITNTVFNTVGEEEEIAVSISEYDTHNMHLYPNPSNGTVYLDRENLDLGSDASFMVYNLLGQRLAEYELKPSTRELFLGDLPDGIYVYKAISNNELVGSGKLVIKR